MKLVFLYDNSEIGDITDNVDGKVIAFKFTSYRNEDILFLNNLFPYQFNEALPAFSSSELPSDLDYNNEREFDIQYMNYILSNERAFLNMMSVMWELYNGSNVCVLVSDKDEYRESLNESLIKFIQQRYGWNANIVKSIDDIEVLEDGDFSPSGILNFDEDKERVALASSELMDLSSHV